MIDLHSHILFGIDDGARDVETSIEMAKAWVADGVSVVACTPHILPGLYHNSGPGIREAVANLQSVLDERGIGLRLVTGADNHIVPDFTEGLRTGHLLTLADTRYVLVEPTHHVLPKRMDELFFNVQAAGYVPVLTHPERLSWISQNYDLVRQLVRNGVWMQITAGSLTGGFGRTPLYWAHKMLDEGLVHIIATDAHDPVKRAPRLSDGYYAAAKRVGDAEAANLVLHRPLGILENVLPSTMPAPPGAVVGSGNADVDASEAYRSSASSRPSADAGGGHAPRGLADRLRSFFK